MKKSLLFIFFISTFFLFNSFFSTGLKAQTSTVTITYGGFQACGGCTVCGADYWCFNTPGSYCGNTAPCGTQTFMDPVPPGNIVTNIAISYFSGQCTGGSLTATINGNAFPTVNEGNTGCPCSGMPCGTSATTGSTFNCGVPNYNYGALNNFQICTGQNVCINRIVLTMTYVPANQATPATQPGAITGTSNVCIGVATTFSIPPVANATGYNWTFPPGWTINSGQGTTSVNATPGSAGNVCVTASNLCGPSASTCFPVTVSTASVAPTSATATPNPICVGSSTTLNVNGGSLGTGANWNWYTGSCGGSLVGSGPSLTVSPGTTTTYYVRAQGTCNTTTCQSVTVTVNPVVNPAWTNPSPICAAAGSINLNTLVTGTVGGTWSGTGVSGSTFNPASGAQSVTYTVGTAPCVQTLNQTITVIPDVNPAWTNPSPVCAAAGSINLNTLVTGTAGGTWSGTGVSGSTFNPASGTQSVTYTVGTAPCQELSALTITVIPDVDPSWTNPSPVCAAAGNVNLNTLVTGTAGGTWSGTGVSGSTFNPASGTQSVTYTVGTAPCQETQTHTINVSAFDPSWTNPGPICDGAATVNLNTLVTGSGGGTFTGTGVTGNNFDPSGLGGTTVTITYTVGAAPCTEVLALSVVVDPAPIITVPSGGVVCEGSTLNLTPSTGGTWTSSNPLIATIDNTGLVTGISAGTTTVVFTDAITGCSSNISSGTITVNPLPIITVPSGGVVCEGSTLNLTPSTGGTWVSSNSAIATIDNTGLVTGISGGTATMVFTDTTTGCSSVTASGTITVNPAPIITVPSGGVVCEGSTLNLTPSTGGTWVSSNSAIATIDNTGLVTGISVGTTTVVFTDTITGCSSNISSGTITVNPLPIITVPSGGVVCEGSTLNLTPSTGGIWVSSNSAIATIDNTGLVTGISGGTATMVFTDTTTGCSSSAASGTITVTPAPIITVPNGGIVCEGSAINLTPSTGGTWASSNPLIATIDNTGLVTGISAGTTTMIFTDTTTGCSSIAASGVVIVGGGQAIITANPTSGLVPLNVAFGNGNITNVSCFWDFGDGSTDTLCDPIHIYEALGSYTTTLIVTDMYGCPDTVTIIIEVIGESSILIPTVFTPNGDGSNDFFRVDGVNLKHVEGEIFNRWGQKMFAWDNVNGYWDGRTLSGSEAPAGTYYFIIKAEGIDGKEYFQKGTLSLIR
jgi:gliding motility-associated-like protein